MNERSTVPPIIIEVLADLESQTAWLGTRMHLYATETIQLGNHGDWIETSRVSAWKHPHVAAIVPFGLGGSDHLGRQNLRFGQTHPYLGRNRENGTDLR